MEIVIQVGAPQRQAFFLLLHETRQGGGLDVVTITKTQDAA